MAETRDTSSGTGVAGMVAAAKAAGLSGPALATAVAYGLAESGGNQYAVNHNTNGSTDYGWWQINSIHGYDPNRLLSDPLYQAQAMKVLSRNGQTWQPWSASAPRMQSFLKQAEDAISGGSTPPRPRGIPDSYVWNPATKTWDGSGFKVRTKDTGGVAGLDAVGDGVGDFVDKVGDALTPDWMEGLGKIAGNLLNPKFWLRIGQGLAAVLLLLVAVGLIFRKQALAVASSVVPTPKGK